MHIYTIYKATNTVNGKNYIGHDSNWPNRKANHRYASKTISNKFYNAIRKYGWDVFEWTVEMQSKEPLLDLEETFIQLYNSREHGYNTCVGGSAPMTGKKHSDQTKDKLRNSRLKGVALSKEHKRKISESKTGVKRVFKKRRPMSLETRKKMSEIAKLRTGSKNPFYGRKHSIETKQKISEANSWKPLEQ